MLSPVADWVQESRNLPSGGVVLIVEKSIGKSNLDGFLFFLCERVKYGRVRDDKKERRIPWLI